MPTRTELIDPRKARSNIIVRASRSIRTRLKPPPRLTVSEWADRYRVLSPEASAESGPWRTSRAPYLREIMDAVSDPTVERVVAMLASQLGKTEAALNVVGYYIDQVPAPILIVQPTLGMAEAWSKDRLAPMIRDSPRLRDRIPPPRSRDSGNTLRHKKFPGGHLTVVGANSPTDLAGRPIRILVGDEVDRYKSSAGAEGDPVDLAVQRTANFWNRKIFLVSSPGLKGESRIESEFLRSDQRRYYVPCPHCEHMQTLRWDNLKWEKEEVDGETRHKPETAAYVCETCGALIEEYYKADMLASDEWRAENPEGEFPGFHMNALYSPWVRWSELVTQWLAAQESLERLKAFVNTKLAETWEIPEEKLDGTRLEDRAESWQADVPMDAALLTAGVDVQGDRLEVIVRAWGEGEESWLVMHQRLWGNPEEDQVWAELETILTKPYRHASGATLRIRACCIDSGYATTSVYAFVRPRQVRGVYATKGMDTRASEPLKRAARANKYGVKLWSVGTYPFKDILFSRLRLVRPGPGYMHFRVRSEGGPDSEYYSQFDNERVVPAREGGRFVRRYVQREGRPNESIDLEVLALVALHTLGPTVRENLGRFAAELAGNAPAAPRRRKPRRVLSRGIKR